MAEGARESRELRSALAAIQKNAELLPLLDAWATTTDLGFVSHACAAAAEQLRGWEKAQDAQPDAAPERGNTNRSAESPSQ